MEERLQRLIEKKRNVFRGGIHLPEGGEFVQILVIQLRQHAGHTALQFPEIDAHAEPVQFPRPDRDPDLPVVAVRPFAVAGIGPEMMTAGKLAFNKDIHAFLSLCSCRACAIIMGGVRRIANFASLVVPLMAVVYILASIVIMFVNFDRIDDVFSLIFRSAFDREAMFSGMLGAAIMWGVKRGIYSNEAGQGTGPQSAAAAEVSHPAKQGFVQAFAVYVDTLFVCSATAFIILSTDMYKVFEGESQDGPVRYAGQLAMV